MAKLKRKKRMTATSRKFAISGSFTGCKAMIKVKPTRSKKKKR